MRLIDADVLSKSVLEWLPSDPCGRPEAEHQFETDICISMLQEIDDAPTIDAVPVARCKDCKHKHLDGMILNCPFGLPGGEDFFCAYGAKGGDKE